MRLLALALILASGTAVAADPADAGLENYPLTMANVRKMAAAYEALDAAAKKNPAIAERLAQDDGTTNLAQLIAKCEGDPAIKAALASAGISARDAVLTQAALATAAGALYLQQQTGESPAGPPAAIANLAFYQQHLAELEPIGQRLQKLDILQPAEDEEGEEPADD
jgi:hypothetical protein